MAEPHLTSLTIEGFRGFKKLELRKLGHVNLLVGKNGVGKSSVLDAVRLHAAQFDPVELRELVIARHETWEPSRIESLSPLFTGWPSLATGVHLLRLGNRWFFAGPFEALRSDGRFDFTSSHMRLDEFPSQAPVIGVCQKGEFINVARWAQFGQNIQFDVLSRELPPVPYVYVPSGEIDHPQIKQLWEAIALTDGESQLVEVLKAVRPDLERVALDHTHPRVRAKVKAFSKPVPLAALGEGLVRAFELATALVNAKNGFLLIDEFENGLHYSVQREIWRIIGKVAHELNVQVFATTHSQDCVRAFSEAAVQQESVGVITRIEERNGTLYAYQFNEELSLEAAREMIEIR